MGGPVQRATKWQMIPAHPDVRSRRVPNGKGSAEGAGADRFSSQRGSRRGQSRCEIHADLRPYRQEHLPTLEHSTRVHATYLLDKYIEPQFGHSPVRAVKPLAINQWLQGLKLAATTKASIRSVMRVSCGGRPQCYPVHLRRSVSCETASAGPDDRGQNLVHPSPRLVQQKASGASRYRRPREGL